MTLSLEELRNELRLEPVDGSVSMAGYSTDATPFIGSKSEAKDEVRAMQQELFDAHELLFAESERSVLLVLQGLDCSGKNGTIKHVVIAMNPAGVRVSSFKEPTEEESKQPFLQRYREELPGPGTLGVFDRSHYEDLIVPTALGQLDPELIQRRVEEVNDFERDLVASGTTIVKCLLHISYDEQRERFLRRLRRDDKRWKFNPSDLETRRSWDRFQAAYASVAGETSPDHAPWYVIPADHKWYRNWVIAKLLLATFDDMDASYPQPDLDVDDLRRRLEPPN
jgi:PPK2 family polyphosphate:nucleotide phosphotransferase